MTDAPSKIIPNTFQTPNLLVEDGLMGLLSGNETKCYIVVIRKTFGWRKDRDRIAKSQIATAAGIAETTVDDCMAALVKFGLVLRTAENNPANAGVEWAPQMDDSQIDYAGLRERQAQAKSANSKRTEKARLARGGDVQQPHHVQQPQGGDVQQPPQQPITTSVLVVVNAGIAEISTRYEQEFGSLTPMIADAIKYDVDTYTAEWVLEAMDIAVKANVRRWNYVHGILKACKAKSVKPSLNRLEKPNANGKPGAKPTRPAELTPEDVAAAERINARSAARV